MWHDLLIWWRGGELLMPIMLTVALILYTVLGERLWALLGPPSRSLISMDRRAAEFDDVLRKHPAGRESAEGAGPFVRSDDPRLARRLEVIFAQAMAAHEERVGMLADRLSAATVKEVQRSA